MSKSKYVKDFLPPPTKCDVCGSSNVTCTTNDVIYRKTYGNWPYIYFCKECKSYVGCHPNTKNPLGFMANEVTRTKRKAAHAAFDSLWKEGYMTRGEAYRWLAERLEIPFKECHISQLSDDQLDKVIEYASVE